MPLICRAFPRFLPGLIIIYVECQLQARPPGKTTLLAQDTPATAATTLIETAGGPPPTAAKNL
ncbi:hypothetical protein J6590_020844 [Homalodisca vitripennis]|nr:hypothetical protein J6590_020844 [Homalodisca vitripennis]